MTVQLQKVNMKHIWFLADRTNGCTIGRVLRPSVVVV